MNTSSNEHYKIYFISLYKAFYITKALNKKSFAYISFIHEYHGNADKKLIIHNFKLFSFCFSCYGYTNRHRGQPKLREQMCKKFVYRNDSI